MDIRNFFGKKPGGGAKKKAETVAVDNEDVVVDKSKVPPSRRRATSTSTLSQQNTTRTTVAAAAAAAAAPARTTRSSPRKSVSAKDSPSALASPSSSSSPSKKRKEVSTADFFAGSPNNTKSNGNGNDVKSESLKKKPKSSAPVDLTNDDDDDDHDDDYSSNLSSLVARKKKSAVDLTNNDDHNDDGDDDDVVVETKPPTRAKRQSTKASSNESAAAFASASSPSPAKKVKKAPSASKAAAKPKPPKRDAPLTPTLVLNSFDTDSAVPECMEGYTFVFSGVLENVSREAAAELVKILGARVTTAVSKKTDYLVVGDILEDGRPYIEGSKYKRAVTEETCIVIKGEEALYGLCKQYDDKARAVRGLEAAPVAPAASAAPLDRKPAPDSKPPPAAATKAAPPVAAAANPYARGPVSNPYAKAAANPYAKKTAPVAASAVAVKSSSSLAKTSDTSNSNMLWVDKYKPASTSEILGNQEAVKKLAIWLKMWESRFNNPQAVGKAFSNPNGPWKAAILSGPPGIGKTTTASLVAKESGRDVLEFNASDVRSKKAMHDVFGDITGSNTIEFKVVKKNGKPQARKKRVIIMDEVDGMGAGDRSGMAELISMIKNTHVPIICICNDRQSQKIRSLVPYCMDLRYRRPVKSVIANRAIAIAAKEGLTVERNAAEAIAESCGNDVRQVLNALQMWSSNNKGTSQLSYKSLKDREHSINKDAILRVSLFDAARVILEGRKGLQGTDAKAQRQHFFRRNDAFFVDYNFVGLLVQQNYLKVMTAPFNDAKRSNDPAKVGDVLDRMYSAAESMSDFAHAENGIRGANMNWGLLPLTAVLTVKTGYHAGGEMGGFLPGFPEFSAWLGKNSSKGRKTRLLHELQHHVNYRISGGNQEMRLSYVPIFRERFLSLLSSKDDNAMDEAIELMDEYGMDRDDIFETLDEFNMDSKADSFAKIDSKAKAAFTRAYNARAHKSQALVAEQGASKAPKRKASSNDETADPDAIDDDKIEEEEEEDDEADVEKLKAMFKKKGRKAAARKPKAASKPKGKKK